mgnify:FL=1
MTQPEKWTAFGDNTVEPTQPALVEARQEARQEVDEPEAEPATPSPNHRTALADFELDDLDLKSPLSLIPIAQALAEIKSQASEARFEKTDASDEAKAKKRKITKCPIYRTAHQRLLDLDGAQSIVELYLDIARKIAGVPK